MNHTFLIYVFTALFGLFFVNAQAQSDPHLIQQLLEENTYHEDDKNISGTYTLDKTSKNTLNCSNQLVIETYDTSVTINRKRYIQGSTGQGSLALNQAEDAVEQQQTVTISANEIYIENSIGNYNGITRYTLEDNETLYVYYPSGDYCIYHRN